jgi:hypothetical protein
MIYGKTSPQDASSTASLPTRGPSVVPQLHVQFFSSPFWRWFSIHRKISNFFLVASAPDLLIGPVLDPNEFSARFIAHTNGSHPLGTEGSILAMLLVIWAATFGQDERGLPFHDGDSGFSSVYGENTRQTRQSSSSTVRPSSGLDTGHGYQGSRKENTDIMLRELLEAIDLHGLLRRPTWDGVRVLLLTIPLLDGEDISELSWPH